MPLPYGNLAPVDLIRQIASPAPQGPGLRNPPPVANILRRLGISDDPFVRSVTDASSANGNREPAKKKKVQAAIDPSVNGGMGGSFTNPQRRPFMLTCQKWIENTDANAVKYLYCRVNPRSVQWTMPLRTSDQKTLGGMVQHSWRQNTGVRRNTFFSEPVLTITFQSGNIMPVTPEVFANKNQTQSETQIPAGLNMFYRFVDLLGDSRVIDVNGDNQANVVYIMYTSHIYPSIVLAGMFTQDGFSFSDNAEDPLKIEWTSTFTVYDSFPRFDRATDLINSWKIHQPPTKSGSVSGQNEANKITQENLADQQRKAESEQLGREISQERQARDEI